MKKGKGKKELRQYSAKNRISVMREKYKGSVSWVLYAEKIQFDAFFKEEKLARQNYECPICAEKILSGATLHHISYDHRCEFLKKTGEFNCQRCKSCCPDLFSMCDTRTVVVHHACHKRLHGRSHLR